MKTAVKPLAAATSATRAAKKIDMGAALNYGKASDLGINSPTHRNTHNADLFGDEPVASKASASKNSNDIIEDIFSSAASSDPIDDFDPRSGEVTADFGDFNSAFGSNAAPTKAPAAAPVVSEFADFSSAFTQSTAIPTSFTSPPVATPSLFPTQSAAVPAAPSPPLDNFLFSSQTATTQSTSNLIKGADLFGNSVITSAFTSPPSSGGNKDLLSDFGDLTLNPIQGKHFKLLVSKLLSFIQALFSLHDMTLCN